MADEPSLVFTDVNERQGAFHRRIFLMGGVVAFGLFALTGRLAQLQVLQAGKYQKLSANNQFNYPLIPPPRGQILDRNGKVIAGNRPSFRVVLETNLVSNIDDTLNQVSYILPQTLTSRRRILRDINQNERSVPTIIAADLDWDDFSKVRLYGTDIPGVVADMSEQRVYYYGGAFSHVVGYVSKVSQKELDAEQPDPSGDSSKSKLLHDPSFRIGKQGIEKAFDLQLRGVPGGKKVEVNSMGQVVAEDPDGSIPPTPGQEIVLTLDADIQQRAVDVFGEQSGAAVMMNVHTGEVLCMTSCPGFDPNLFVSGIPTADYSLLAQYEKQPLLDKAIGSTFPPGSTFKTMVALAALENGYDPKTTHTCNGVFPFGNHVFKCDQHHGTLDLHGAIVTSCDVYFYQCALATGPDKIAATARRFGLGQIFDINIEGQRAGVVPDTTWKREYFAKRDPANTRWYPGETPSMGIGQGFTNVSALQNCVMVSRLANGAKAVNPILVKSINGVDQVNKAVIEDLPLNPDHLAFVRAAMADVVAAKVSGATGANAQLNLGPIMMAGKTGTAQAVGAGGGRTAHGAVGEWKLRDHGWFVAFAPADAPKYACAVIVQHGGFGGTAAAPIAREIMRVALLKDPDIQKRIVGFDTTDRQPLVSPNAVQSDPDTVDNSAPDTPPPPTDTSGAIASST